MAGEREFQLRIQQMGNSVEKLEEVADPATRTRVKLLVQSVLELHGTGFEKTLEIIFNSGDGGQKIIDQLGKDPLVGSLLVLYGLHPEDIEARVASAVDRVRPQMRKQGSEVELLQNQGGMVRAQVKVGGHACGSTAATIRTMLEDAIYEAAPDLSSLEIEGLEGKPASGFIALDALVGHAAATTRGDGAD